VLAGLTLPKSVFALAVETEKSNQQDDLEKALKILCMEDPSLHVDLDKESGQTLIRGIGELHLEIVCDKLKRQFNIPVNTGRAYVAFRESLSIDHEESYTYTYDKTIGTKKFYASFTFVVRRKEGDNMIPTINYEDVKHSLSQDERTALEESFEGSVNRGPAGYPAVGFDVDITSFDRDSHTCPGSIRACISMFISSILRGPYKCLLEPIMSTEVYVPTSCLGEVLSDLSIKRRGVVKEVRTEDGNSIISAHVPFVTMLGYASSVRSMTQGEGSFAMEYLEHVVVDEAFLKHTA
jgi:elongation factor G